MALSEIDFELLTEIKEVLIEVKELLKEIKGIK